MGGELSVEASDVVEGPQVTRVKVTPAAGVKVASRVLFDFRVTIRN